MSLCYESATFGYMPKSDIVGSWDRLILIFLRNQHTNIQSGCTSLHFQQKWKNLPFTSHLLQHKVLSVFLMLGLLSKLGARGKMSGKWGKEIVELEEKEKWYLNRGSHNVLMEVSVPPIPSADQSQRNTQRLILIINLLAY